MDSTSRRPQLPALSYLEVGSMNKDDDRYQSRHNTATQSHANGPLASPTNQYPAAPPPPYTLPAHHHANNTWATTNHAAHTPPASRRTSGDDHGSNKQTTLQSLPSLSEALGPLDNQPSYPPPASTTAQAPPPPPATQLPTPQSGAPRSPVSATRRSYPMEPPQPQTHSHYAYFRQDSAGPPYASTEPARPANGPPHDQRPPMPAQTPQPPRPQPPSSHSYPKPMSPRLEQQAPHPADSMAPPPPPTTFAYGYTPYPPRFAPSTPSSTSGPVYQPSAHHPAPSTPSSAWRAEGAPSKYPDERPTPAVYGESVKRHMDMFDFEAFLNEIATTSSHLNDFSRRYGDRMHQSARTGPSLSTLPSLVEVDDMITKARIQLDSLTKIREVVLTQQAAYEQQIADQHQRQRHDAYAEPPLPQSGDAYPESDQDKGFAGSETKKRRGRAAPPGRCHSCNRAETPEWRRGPDGARTLCNACGLHYAKLTRKQTNGGKNGAAGSSNLRPKEA